MNKNDERFQKRSAIYQMGLTALITVAAVMMSVGFTYTQFGISPTESHSTGNLTNDQVNQINHWTESVRGQGQILIYLGAGFIVLFLILFLILIMMDTSKPKLGKSWKTILFDEMYDGKDIELGKRGYDTESIKKLRLTGEPLHYDYSVIKYAEENKMVIITEDPEILGGCEENNLPCIKLGQNPSIDEIIKELEKLTVGKS